MTDDRYHIDDNRCEGADTRRGIEFEVDLVELDQKNTPLASPPFSLLPRRLPLPGFKHVCGCINVPILLDATSRGLEATAPASDPTMIQSSECAILNGSPGALLSNTGGRL